MKSGGVQKPKAGVLGSHDRSDDPQDIGPESGLTIDSATGAPENHKGEAVEQEASNFVNGIASVALSSAAGKHPQDDPEDGEGSAHDAVPDPTAIATGAAAAKDSAAGGKPSTKHDKTKVPMETVIWTQMRPVMHGLAGVCGMSFHILSNRNVTDLFRHVGTVRERSISHSTFSEESLSTSFGRYSGTNARWFDVRDKLHAGQRHYLRYWIWLLW